MSRFRFLIFVFLIFVTSALYCADIVEEVVWESPLAYSDFERLVKIKEGEALSIKKIRRTVKLLYASKKFEKIDVSSEKTGSGKVKIIIKGTPQLIIEEIKIKGNYNLTDRELKLASGIGLNSLYFEDNIAKIREEIVYYYRENGYFSVRVSIATEKISPTAIKMTIDIKEGPQEKIQKFILKGTFNKTEFKKLKFDLEAAFKGRPYTDKNITEIEYFVTDRYKELGFLNISISSEKRKNGAVALTVNKGSHFSINVEGAYWFSPDTVKKVIKDVPNYHFDTAGIQKKLEILYQAYGFHDAEIKAEILEKNISGEDFSTINVKIKENERRFINEIVINGAGSEKNRKIVTERLSDFIEDRIDEENFPRIMINRTTTGGGYIDSDGRREKTLKDSRKDKIVKPDSPHAIPKAYLEEIREMTEKIYQSGGYADVEVGNVQIADNDGRLSLNIDVTENTQYFLSGVEAFSGDEKLDKAMKKKIKLPKPVPFNERIVQAYQKRITDFLTDEGYIFSLSRTKRGLKATKSTSLSMLSIFSK